jgi:hypothetical protein
MSGATSNMWLEDLVQKYRRTAVLLHSRYPPYVGEPGNSKFGGFPTLPAHYEWPRTANGTPLHFFAQIDCAEITFPTPLPGRGVLFFFGRDEDEHLWDDPTGDCRVLYAPDGVAGPPPREPPADLMPVGGIYNSHWREYLRDREPGPNFHVEWPLHLLPIDTWPDNAMYGEMDWPDEEESDEYAERLQELREEALTRAIGERPELDPAEITPQWRAARAIFAHAEDGPEAYPQHWITIHYAARALLHRPARFSGDTALQAQMAAAAEEWLRRSNEAGHDSPVTEEDRRAFRAWLRSLERGFDDSGLGSTGTDLVLLSLLATIRAWAGDADRAARVPPHVYEALRFYFAPPSHPGVHFSQMLGHAPSAQSPLDPGDPTVCLLNLASDRGIGWTFGDAGYCTFFIDPDDLAEREFSRVWGTIVGY